MAAAAHNPEFAKKVGISQKVAKEFNAADKGKKFGTGGALKQGVNNPKTDHGKDALFKKGGSVKHDDIQEDKKLIKRAFGMHDKQEHGGKHTDLSKLKKGGNVKKMAKGGSTKEARMEPATMAHEVEKVVPEAVITRPDGYKMVNYGAIQGVG